MQPEPLAPPFPILASGNGIAPILVTFSEPLQPGVFNAANWSIRWAGNAHAVTAATVAPPPLDNQVMLLIAIGLPNPGPDVVNFSPPPFDIISGATGLPAAAFANFPLGP